jgi:hypothetical protein
VPAELAESGATPGVAVQFTCGLAGIRSRLGPLAGPIDESDERKTNKGRRSAPRARARVPAKIQQLDRGSLEGRTRNVSDTGVLLSVEGEPVPVGNLVTLSIVHPGTGETMELGGRVARHLKDENGEVNSIGVHFDISEEDKGEVVRFLGDLRASEHSRHLGGIAGAISELGIENLLQMFGTSASQGTLTLLRGEEEGYLAFEKGLLWAARAGAATGSEALARMLSWKDGTFEFHARIDPADRTGAPLPLEGAILDAARALDEASHGATVAERRASQEDQIDQLVGDEIGVDDLLEDSSLLPAHELLGDVPASFPPDAFLRVDQVAVDAVRSELGKTEEAILDLAGVGMSVGKILAVIPEPEQQIFDVLGDLMSRGLVFLQD